MESVMRSLAYRPSADPSADGILPTRSDPSTLAQLDDQALLELLLGRCLPHPRVGPAAAALMNRFGSLGDVAVADVSELGRVVGIGPAAILDLRLLREFSVRLSRATACARPVLSSWNALEAYGRVAQEMAAQQAVLDQLQGPGNAQD